MNEMFAKGNRQKTYRKHDMTDPKGNVFKSASHTPFGDPIATPWGEGTLVGRTKNYYLVRFSNSKNSYVFPKYQTELFEKEGPLDEYEQGKISYSTYRRRIHGDVEKASTELHKKYFKNNGKDVMFFKPLPEGEMVLTKSKKAVEADGECS